MEDKSKTITVTQSIKSIILGIITLFWTSVIFSFSMQPATQSNQVSDGLLKKILDIFYGFTKIIIEQDQVIHIFRKLAHYTEFFILGIFATLFFLVLTYKNIRRENLKPYIYAICYGIIIAISDETIQFYTGAGRAMRITDMLIDSSGVLTSLLIIWKIINSKKITKL